MYMSIYISVYLSIGLLVCWYLHIYLYISYPSIYLYLSPFMYVHNIHFTLLTFVHNYFKLFE